MSASDHEYFPEPSGSQRNQSEGTDFSAPLGSLKGGRLVFASGAERLELTSSAAITDLYRAHFGYFAPRVWVKEGTITIRDRRFPSAGRPVNSAWRPAKIRLNGSIPWEIEFRRGVSHLTADLAQLQLRSLDILGGAYQIQLLLSEPSGSAFIYISGGIHQGLIRVPPTTGVRVQISGGSSNLIFVDQHLGRVGSEASLESIGYAHARQRYDIRITGGSRDLTIERKVSS